MKIGRIIIFPVMAALVFTVGFVLGANYMADRASRSEMLAEFKVDYGTLERDDVSPQLREYLKSRLYYLACQLEPRDLQGVQFDFGAVDEKIGLSGIKGPETDAEVYRMAMARHNQSRR